MSTYSNFTVKNPFFGSFLYSVARGASISLSNSDLNCQVTAPVYDKHLKQALLFSQDPPKYGGAIYVQNALHVVSTNCLTLM